MPSYSSAAARIQPEFESKAQQSSQPRARIYEFPGVRTPPPPAAVGSEKNVLAAKFAEFDRQRFADKAAETAAAREIASYVHRLEIERQFEPLRVELDVLREQVAQMAQRPIVNMDHYVAAPTIAKVASRLIFLVCLFSILLWLITGFVMIHPIIAAVTMIGCVGFHVMGTLAARVLR